LRVAAESHGFSSYQKTVVQLHCGEFAVVEFTNISKNISKSLQTHHKLLTNSKNILLLHKVVEKRHAALENAKRSLAEKQFGLLLLKNHRAHPGKTKLHQNVQIHLQMQRMQQVDFKNIRSSSRP